MANTAHQAVYFPTLDKCFSGAETIISWTTAHAVLQDFDSAEFNTTLESFFRNEQTLAVLKQQLKPFPRPSPQTKADFDNKTAPIHVSQSVNGDYNLQQLKDDALWMSKELNIDEVSALRCAIIEWQQRPVDSLLGKIRNEDGGQVMKQSLFGRSTMRFGASINRAASTGPDFENTEFRRQRLLGVVLAETSAARACTAILIPLVVANIKYSAEMPVPFGGRWIDDVAGQVYRLVVEDASRLSTYIQQLRDLARQLGGSAQWLDAFKERTSLSTTYLDHLVQDMVSVLRTLLGLVFALDTVPSSTDTKLWFSLMGDNLFFGDMASFSTVQQLYVPILQFLVSATSVAILKPTAAIEEIRQKYADWKEQVDTRDPTAGNDGNLPYVLNKEGLGDINANLHDATERGIRVAGPAIYAWACVNMAIRDLTMDQQQSLHPGDDSDDDHSMRAGSARTTSGKSWIESLWETLQSPPFRDSSEDDPALHMAKVALDVMHVYGIIKVISNDFSTALAAKSDMTTALIARSALYDLVQISLAVASYGPEVLEAIMALLQPETQSTLPPSALLPLVLQATDNEQFRVRVLGESLTRYPYEISPLLQLLVPLASVQGGSQVEAIYLFDLFDNHDTFTVQTPEHFNDYVLENEDEGRNEMRLTASYPIFKPSPSLGYWQSQHTMEDSRALVLADGSSSSVVATIPAQTLGHFCTDRRPFIMRLIHPHSGFAYLGMLLSTALPHSEVVSAATDEVLDKQTTSEIVDFMNALMRTADTKDVQDHTLGRFGAALKEETDIAAIVAEIAEMELMAHSDRNASEDSLALLVSCISFFDNLACHSPERAWSWLSRSSLLGNSGTGISTLVAVVSGAEVPSGRYKFLRACVELYQTMLDDAIGGVVKRKPKVETVAIGRRRFDSPMETAEQTPERTVSKVLADFTKLARGVLLGLGEWSFEVLEERTWIVTAICQSLDTLLTAAYGIGSGKDDSKRLNHGLIPAATTQTVSDFVLAPLNSILAQGSDIDDAARTIDQQNVVAKQTRVVLRYLTTVARTLKFCSNTAGSLPAQIISLMPMLTPLMASSESYRAPIAALLSEVLSPASEDSSDIPALLGQLSPETCKNFLALLSQLDRPMKDVDVEREIWRFLSTILNGSQQFFAMYLLTGSMPKERYKAEKDTKKHKTLLGHALEQLVNISAIEPARAIAMLHFVAKAQQVWIWANNEIAKSDFLKSALAWIDTLNAWQPNFTPQQARLSTGEFQIAALICDILAVNLHTSLEIGDKSMLKLVAPKLKFLSEHAVKVDAYNLSLHKNFAQNLPKAYPCEPTDFVRTSANPAPMGDEYVYDLGLAEKMLGTQRGWSGNEGFREEFVRSSCNLSLVEAQTRLLRSWKTLATTISDAVETEQALQSALATTAMRALEQNLEANLETPFAAGLLQTRADLAFVLLSRLSGTKGQTAQMRDMLPLAWSLVRTSPVDYATATAPEDLQYYTTTLQILYLALLPHATPVAPNSSNSDVRFPLAIGPTLLDILTHTIAPSFRTLCANLHTSTSLASPSDFALLGALLRALFSVHDLTPLQPRLATAIADSNLIRSALALYSWSPTLSPGDPIHATLALSLLSTLSTVPAIAQTLAVEGALAQLSSASLSDAFRKPGGKGPFDEPARCFQIWSEGLLPICVNLLAAIGPAIAPEIAAFLNSFPAQLRRAETALANSRPTPRNPRAGAVNLGLVCEARDLVLIAAALASARALGPAEGLRGDAWPGLEMEVGGLKGDLSALGRNERAVRERLVEVSERQVEAGVTGLVKSVVRIAGSVEDL